MFTRTTFQNLFGVKSNVRHTHKAGFWYLLRITSDDHSPKFYVGVLPTPSLLGYKRTFLSH